MTWSVEATDEFVAWWDTLDDSAKGSIDAYVRLLEDQGPQLPFPYSSGIEGSRHGRMRELRVQSKGDPLRVFYEFYLEMIPVADRLYDEHLADIGQDDKGSRRK